MNAKLTKTENEIMESKAAREEIFNLVSEAK
jgi:hypothetical protein